MSKYNYFLRYVLIIRMLREGPVLFSGIRKAIEADFEYRGEPVLYNLRTFQRDKNDISRLFHIEIACNGYSEYYIKEDEPSHAELNSRLLETFDLLHSLHLKKRMEKYIQLEPRCKKGTEFLPDILMATKQQRVMEIYHQDFEVSLSVRRLIEPYGIKEFKGRWYLVAYDTEKKDIRVWGLDRIDGIRVLSQRFLYKDSCDIADYFKNYFGIVRNDSPPERIVLSTDVLYGKFLKARPLHHSQRIVAKSESECYVELYLAPTYDFVQELLSMFERATVIEPVHLKEELLRIHRLCIEKLSS